jgi:thimet oligopeptidase
MRRAIHVTVLGAVLACSALAAQAAEVIRDDVPFWNAAIDSTAFASMQEARLERAAALIAEVKAVKGGRSVDNTLRPYDEALRHLANAARQSGLIANVHPDEAMRTGAEDLQRRISKYWTDLTLDPGLYKAISALDVRKADPETRHYVEKEVRDFRLAGVDRDEATREKVKAIQEELVQITQAFGRNIRDDASRITVDGVDELDGLPADYIAKHPAGEDGKIVLTTQGPDAFPVFSYASNDAVRKRMFMAYTNRAYPENMTVLDQMIAKRHELATTLSFASYADLITADKMSGNARTASDFIDRIVTASRPIGDREYAQLLTRKRADDPAATEITEWERSYYSELVRRSDYDFDAQAVRPYFAFDRVQQGVLDVTAKLFGVEFRRVEDAPVWHPSVECWEMFEDGELRGRFYLDLHPRANKYSHAAHFGIRSGVKGVQIPEAALVCNFPGGEEGDPGLMEHSQVETFFHEFGHLLHNMFAGRHQWHALAGVSTERDFVEAPSQMLEEWAWDPVILATFAKHHETGEPIPAALVQKMKNAEEFGKALGVLRQMVFARISLSFYDRDPQEVDTDRLVQTISADYVPFKNVSGTHFQTSFGHLSGYSAMYYTYMWSLVIAKDMFSAFDPNRMFEPKVAKRYRERVLAPGGSKPAAKLVEDFLGRPFNSKAWERWLASQEQTSTRVTD